MKNNVKGFLGASKKFVLPALIAVVALSFLYHFLIICVYGNVIGGLFSILLETGFFALILVFWLMKKDKLVEYLFWIYFAYYLMSNLYALPGIFGIGGPFGDVLYDLLTYTAILVTAAIGVFFVIEKYKGESKCNGFINCLAIIMLCLKTVAFIVYFINVFALKGYLWTGIFNSLFDIAIVFFFITYVNKDRANAVKLEKE